MVQSLSLLGVLTAGIGGFLLLAMWDRNTHPRNKTGAYLLIALGVVLYIIGVVI